ncbi:MAG: DUF2452 domain-containing protein [Halioglobus sp.]|nr:DUF2452 domain-containing protein [Halioglobus sp.]
MPVTSANQQKTPNPQGKGLVPTLGDLALFNPDSVRRKPPLEFFRDYCVSSLVLAARFQFRPVVGRGYFLYSRDDTWLLSLISPEEWGAALPGTFVATCTLRSDMTWQVAFTAVEENAPLSEKLQNFVDGFTEALASQDDILGNLPFFVAHLPYYQRVLATGLAASLKLSSPPAPALAAALEGRVLARHLTAPTPAQ